MKYYGKSKEVCENILNQFKNGNIPETMKQVFVNRTDDIPCQSWSFSNQFITAIYGTSDARGFKQWGSAGRKVKKGSKAIYILGPCIITDKEDKEKKILIGFKSIPVFKIEDTEVFDADLWDKANKVDESEENRLAELPFIEVAKSWNLTVKSFNGQGGKYLGYYQHGSTIAVGTQNLSTWAHELIHAADDKNGTISHGYGQKQDNEVVAELGGATLLKLTGMEYDADLGGCWEYISGYCGHDQEKTIKYCMKMVNRISACINLVMETMENVAVKVAA